MKISFLLFAIKSSHQFHPDAAQNREIPSATLDVQRIQNWCPPKQFKSATVKHEDSLKKKLKKFLKRNFLFFGKNLIFFFLEKILGSFFQCDSVRTALPKGHHKWLKIAKEIRFRVKRPLWRADRQSFACPYQRHWYIRPWMRFSVYGSTTAPRQVFAIHPGKASRSCNSTQLFG